MARKYLPSSSRLDAFLARKHRVGLGAGGDQNRARGQLDAVLEGDRAGVPELVDLDARRRQPFGENDAFLERLGDFLVVEGVGGAVDHAAPVGDGHAAPALQQTKDAVDGERRAEPAHAQ